AFCLSVPASTSLRPLSADSPHRRSVQDPHKHHRWAVTGSNRRPPACKAGALPAELTARVRGPTKAPTAGNPDYRPAPLTVAGRTRADQASISVLLAYRGRIRGGPLLHRGRA